MDKNDDRIKWFETHISNALKPKIEDLKQLTSVDENKRALVDFINNEDIRRLYVYKNDTKLLTVSLDPPSQITGKAIFFLKNLVTKITRTEINDQVSYFESTGTILDHMHLMLKEVYLPLLCGNPRSSSDPDDGPMAGVNVDKLMDVMHRVMASVEVASGQSQNEQPLALPSVEVLAEAATVPGRMGAVLHILETTVINWMKQIRIVLRHDQIKEVFRRFGPEPGVLDEFTIWMEHREALESIVSQLGGPVTQDILTNLGRANSAYYHSFGGILDEIRAERDRSVDLLTLLEPLRKWFERLHRSRNADEMVHLFPAIMRIVFLLWKDCRYYHQSENLQHFLRVLSNEVVHRALSLVDGDVMRDPLKSHSKLQDVLRICATFRGNYLDTRDKANEINTRNVDENAEKLRLMPRGQLWPAKVYGPYAYRPSYVKHGPSDEILVDDLLLDSAWPPRNAECFDLLNTFMERCNDCMELVQTTQHFRLLADTAEIGGAGSRSLDALVREIHDKYNKAMNEFFSKVHNVLDLSDVKSFERAFFNFRTVVKDLEKTLGNIINESMHQCPNVMSQLSLLEVFEGINGRDVVHDILRDKDKMITDSFIEELKTVEKMIQKYGPNPPTIPNVPPFVSSLRWYYALKERMRVPLEKMKAICPHLLTGETGWQLKDLHRDCIEAITKYEQTKMKEWQKNNKADLTECLKQPLLVLDEFDGGPPQIRVNLDAKLILLLKETRYLLKFPYEVELPANAQKLLNTTDLSRLRYMATRLESIAAKYNYAMRCMSPFEKLLLERQLNKLEQVLEQGLQTFTWRTEESMDLIERATVLVCHDLANALNTVQSNSSEIIDLTESWCSGVLDLFTARQKKQEEYEELPCTVEEMQSLHKEVIERTTNYIIPSGHKIHQYLDSSLTAVQISKASPAWEEYVDYFDAVLMNGLKTSTVVSLSSILNQIIECNMQTPGDYMPIISIRLELLDTNVVFRPPLEQATNRMSVQEYISQWVIDYIKRSGLITMLSNRNTSSQAQLIGSNTDINGLATPASDDAEATKSLAIETSTTKPAPTNEPTGTKLTKEEEEESKEEKMALLNLHDAPDGSNLGQVIGGEWLPSALMARSYRDYIVDDEEVTQLCLQIIQIVQKNASECAEVRGQFTDYTFLWDQDIEQSFQDFLSGRISPNPLRTPSKSQFKQTNMFISRATSRTSSGLSRMTAEEEDIAERSFLTPKAGGGASGEVPSLDEFHAEIDIFKTSRDELEAMPRYQDVGWLRVDLEPIKEVLITLASKWMWTFTKYLADQIATMLEALQEFLARIEPEIESITGEERDTVSFMRMMRLFNEVSAQQHEMEGKFSAMHRTVELLNRYEYELPARTQSLLKTGPSTWNALRTKVGLAKQRLGPRISQEAPTINKDLAEFQDRIDRFQTELEKSDVFNPSCSLDNARLMMDNFSKRLTFLENEAQDLVELQELLDANIVDFTVLPKCRADVDNLKLVWDTAVQLQTEQNEWKRHRWQRMNTKFLEEATDRQIKLVESLPEDTKTWELYGDMMENIQIICVCVSLMEELVNPAMRTRHWKQVVRVTGVQIHIDSDTLRRMTLGELLTLGLQDHVDEVKAVVKRAVKDLKIEQSLKNFEEIWLSKMFELKRHTRNVNTVPVGYSREAGKEEGIEGTASDAGLSDRPSVQASRARTTSRISSQSLYSRGGGRPGSQFSLPPSMAGLLASGEDGHAGGDVLATGDVWLLAGTDELLEELEDHQKKLQDMAESKGAGSFLDEVLKWQKQLQTIEQVLRLWVLVQETWRATEEIFHTPDVRTVLAHDANKFQIANKDFRLLMKATEKNPNVLQCCSRKNIHIILEKTNSYLERCRKALLNFLDRQRGRFPWFYFLAPEDVLHIIGNSYDIGQLNTHIRSLWENVGALLHREVTSSNPTATPEEPSVEIYGIRSVLKEPLYFKKPVPVKGSLDAWLSQVVMATRTALRHQLALALGRESREPTPTEEPQEDENSPPPDTTEGSRLATGSTRKTVPPVSTGPNTNATPGPKRVMPRKSPLGSALKSNLPEKQAKQDMDADRILQTRQISDIMEDSGTRTEERDWILNHVTEIILLITKLRFTVEVNTALEEPQPLEALDLCIASNETSRKEIKQLLRSLEGHEEKLSAVMSEVIKGSESVHGSKSMSHGLGTSDLTVDQTNRTDGKKEENATDRTGNAGEDVNAKEIEPISLERQPEDEEGDDQPDVTSLRRRLLPSQLHKVRTLLSLLTEHRGTLLHLKQIASSPTSNSSSDSSPDAGAIKRVMEVWDREMKYALGPEMNVSVKSVGYQFEYSFSYLGSCERQQVTQKLKWSINNILATVQSTRGGLCCSDKTALPYKVVLEAAKILGKPYYILNCSQSTTRDMLANIFRGAAATGSWICLRNINRLSADQLSVLAQLCSAMFEAQRAVTPSVNLLGEDIIFYTSASKATDDADEDENEHEKPSGGMMSESERGGGILATLDRVQPGLMEERAGQWNFTERPVLFSSVVSVPCYVLQHFRVLSVPPAELPWLANSLFTSQGYQTVSETVDQLVDFISAATELIGCVMDKTNWVPQLPFSSTNLTSLITRARKHLTESKSILSASQELHLSEAQMASLERESVILALRDLYIPRLNTDQIKIFYLLLKDTFPDSKGLTEASHRTEEAKMARVSSLIDSRILATTESVQSLAEEIMPRVNLIPTAIQQLELEPAKGFQDQVDQYLALYDMYRTVVLTGPAGSGKTTVIKVAEKLHQLQQHEVVRQTVFPGALDTQDFLGYYDKESKCWHNGLLQIVLKNFSYKPVVVEAGSENKIDNILVLDGLVSVKQRQALSALIYPNDTVVLDNGEHLTLPPNFHVVWETESLADIHPGLLAFVGIMVVHAEGEPWRLELKQWSKTKTESEADILEHLFNLYVPHIVAFISKHLKATHTKQPTLFNRHVTQSFASSLRTSTYLLDGILHSSTVHDIGAQEYELLVTYACLWGFGANLDRDSRNFFSEWWRNQFKPAISYPTEGSMFDYFVDLDRMEYLPWTEMIPTYAGVQNAGLSPDTVVLTGGIQALVYNLSLISDMMRPVLLVGSTGCGKSSIVNDRIRSVCSGEVAEVLNVTVHCNRFTTSKLIATYLDEKLEWKHGTTYVAKGNKRLMAFVDDLNLSQTDPDGLQTSVELIRQMMDQGGHHYPEEHQWRQLKNVHIVATANPKVESPTLMSQRVLRHFAVLAVNYPEICEQESIFSLMIRGHFLPPNDHSTQSGPVSDEKRIQQDLENKLGKLLDQLVKVTVNLQSRLSSMFLPIAQRCHYIFSMRSLTTIFRNLCHSLNSSSTNDSILTLWRNEVYWVFNERMIDVVDQDRYWRAYVTSVKKEFAEEYKLQDELLEVLLHPTPPLCSNIALQESGLVSCRQSKSESDPDSRWGDGYTKAPSVNKIRDLLIESIAEFNKINPKILIPLYDQIVAHISRISRTLSTPHNLGHMCLVTDGNPGQAYFLVRLAAHLNNFKMVMPSPLSEKIDQESKFIQFKKDLVNAYTSAGVKSEKTVLVIRDFELVDRDFLVYLTELVAFGTITHLFSPEEQTQIINSIRTEVSQPGSAYTRDLAWDYFLKSVRENIRICLIVSKTGEEFQSWCRDYPSLLSTITFIWFQHWSKPQLVEHALYNLNLKLTGSGSIALTHVEKENMAHLLATMHLVMRQQDGGEEGQSRFRHVNNTTYHKFVEKFCDLLEKRFSTIDQEQHETQLSLAHIQQEGRLARRLQTQLRHEKMVLEERQKGANRILTQIGQDTAITESQMRIVRQQIDKIKRLKKLLPEYQIAHERAVYKAIATVKETKKAVQNLTKVTLSDLRSINKPSLDIEDLMAGVIMILKSPNSDLTWHKGGKRQLANLERFVEELLNFDDQNMSEETLSLVQAHLNKNTMGLEYWTSKTAASPPMSPKGDGVEVGAEEEDDDHHPDSGAISKAALTACTALSRWVHGVASYHSLMQRRVKPLHIKVEATSKEMEEAETKMKSLHIKKAALETRLSDLATSFEEATIDKNNQDLKAEKMDRMLATASQLRRVMSSEYRRFHHIHSAHQDRVRCAPGGVAMAAGLCIYLGPYHYSIRCRLLSYYWPKCLQERGIPLIVDSIDVAKGRVIDFTLFSYKWSPLPFASLERDASVAESTSSRPSQRSDASRVEQEDGLPEEETLQETTDRTTDESTTKEEYTEDTEQENTLNEDTTQEEADTSKEQEADESQSTDRQQQEDILDDTAREEEVDDKVDDNAASREGMETANDWSEEGDMEDIPLLNSRQYTEYFRALVGLIVGRKRLAQWTLMDLSLHQLLNAAIIDSSHSRPPFLIDPHGIGLVHLQWLINSPALAHKQQIKSIVEIDMSHRWSDPQLLSSLEDAIMQGRPILMKNCVSQPDNLLEPLVHHNNMIGDTEEIRIIRFGTRRILCHPGCRPYFSTELDNVHYTGDIASLVTLVNYGVSEESLVEDLVNRAFNKLKPELYKDRRLAVEQMEYWRNAMAIHSGQVRSQLTESMNSQHMWSETTMNAIAQGVGQLRQANQKLLQAENVYKELTHLRDTLEPLARHAAIIYSTLSLMRGIQPEYNFSLPYFLSMFDEAISKDIEEADEAEKDDSEETEDQHRLVRQKTKQSLTTRFSDSEMKHDMPEPEDDDDSETDYELPQIIKGEESDKGFVEIVLSSREAEERHKVMQEITGRQEMSRELTTVTSIDTFLKNRGTLRPRKVLLAGNTDEAGVKPEEAGSPPASAMSDNARRKRSSVGAGLVHMVGHNVEDVVLPTPGVEYVAPSEFQLREITRHVTELIYQRVRMSLFEEDVLLLALLLFMYTELEARDQPSGDEVHFFLKGQSTIDTNLSLKYFNCDLSVPDWMPAHLWKEIIGISLIQGPMNSLCVHIASNSEAWKEWFESYQPEVHPAPIIPASAHKDNDPETDQSENPPAEEPPSTSSVTAFHQLLLIRLLRPERLQQALHLLLSTSFPFTGGPIQPTFRLSALQPYMSILFTGVLAVYQAGPKIDAYRHNAFFPKSDISVAIKRSAQSLGVFCEQINCNSTSATLLGSILETSHHTGGWVIVQDAHLLDYKGISVLSKYLDPNTPTGDKMFQETPRLEDPSSNGALTLDVQKQSVIWITVPSGSGFPDRLSRKIANYLAVVTDEAITEYLGLDGESEEEEFKPPAWRLTVDYVQNALSSVFHLIDASILEEELMEGWQKVAYSGFCICTALVLLRQSMGARGVSVWKVIGEDTAVAAMETISYCDSPDKVVPLLISNVLDRIFISDLDIKYVRCLFQRVLGGLSSHVMDVPMGAVTIAIPPESIQFVQIDVWLWNQPWARDENLAALTYLETAVIDAFYTRRTDAILACVERTIESTLYQGHKCSPSQQGPDNASDAESQSINADHISMVKLSTVLDFCRDNLPPLLEPHGLESEVMVLPSGFQSQGQKAKKQGGQGIVGTGNPLISDSSGSMDTKTDDMNPISSIIPEILSHVLLEECRVYNAEMSTVRSTVNRLSQYVITGAHSMPGHWLRTALRLEREILPHGWAHGDDTLSTHNLTSWIKYQTDRYKQLERWMRLGVTHGEFKSTTGGGLPRWLWLGGLYRPQAFLTALKHEKAMAEGCSVRDVRFSIELTNSFSTKPFECTEEDAFFITAAYISGGSQTAEKQLHSSTKQALTHMPTFLLRVITQAEINSEQIIYPCPVFKNQARHTVIAQFHVESAATLDELQLKGTAIILDPGCLEEYPLRPRIPIVTQPSITPRGLLPLPPPRASDRPLRETREESSVLTESRLETLQEEEEGSKTVTERTSTSDHQSQQSYKPFTPNAEPLPSDLQMQRQPALGGSTDRVDGGEGSTIRSQGNHTPQRTPSNASLQSGSEKSAPRSIRGSGASSLADVHGEAPRSKTNSQNSLLTGSQRSILSSNKGDTERSKQSKESLSGDHRTQSSASKNEKSVAKSSPKTVSPAKSTEDTDSSDKPRFEPEHSTIYEEKTQLSLQTTQPANSDAGVDTDRHESERQSIPPLDLSQEPENAESSPRNPPKASSMSSLPQKTSSTKRNDDVTSRSSLRKGDSTRSPLKFDSETSLKISGSQDKLHDTSYTQDSFQSLNQPATGSQKSRTQSGSKHELESMQSSAANISGAIDSHQSPIKASQSRTSMDTANLSPTKSTAPLDSSSRIEPQDSEIKSSMNQDDVEASPAKSNTSMPQDSQNSTTNRTVSDDADRTFDQSQSVEKKDDEHFE